MTNDTFYLHSRVTLCDERKGHPCQPVSRQAWEIQAVPAASAWRRWRRPLGTATGEPGAEQYANAATLGAGLRRGLEDGGAGDRLILLGEEPRAGFVEQTASRVI